MLTSFSMWPDVSLDTGMPVMRDTTVAMSSAVTESCISVSDDAARSSSLGSFCSSEGITPNRSSDARPKLPSLCAMSSSTRALSRSAWVRLMVSISALSFSIAP